MSNKLKENLKKLLFESELTPTELSRRIDIPQQTIQRITKGKINNPHPKTLEALAQYFGVSTNELQDKKIEDTPLFTAQRSSQTVNVFTWDKLKNIANNLYNVQFEQTIIVSTNYSSKTLGVIMSDSSRAPYFHPNSILIIDPLQKPDDRSFVITYLHDNQKYIFRQLLSDGENFFLKALNSDLSTFPVRKLDKDDKTIGVLVETRQIYSKSIGS